MTSAHNIIYYVIDTQHFLLEGAFSDIFVLKKVLLTFARRWGIC